MRIGSRDVSRDAPFFIADVGSNHDGSLGRALRLIELAASAGASAVKFQSFRAETIVSRRGFAELGQTAHQRSWSAPVYETYERSALPMSWIPILAEHCGNQGVEFMTTAYAPEILDAIDEYVPAHKIGSGDVDYLELIDRAVSKGKPVLLSTGASSGLDVERARRRVRDVPLVLMQCNTNYEDSGYNPHLNLRVLSGWAMSPYLGTVGLSDHTRSIIPVLLAVALGATVIERHFTDDTGREGPDHGFAMDPLGWRTMVRSVEAAGEMLGDGVKRVEPNEVEARVVQRRALRWVRDIPAGRRVEADDVRPTRPFRAGNLPPYELDRVRGRTLRTAVTADTPVSWGELGP